MNVRALASSSKANCIVLGDGGTSLLLDAGLPFRVLREALDFRLSDIAAVLITHAHQDHCRAVPDLLKAGVDCYMSEATASELSVTGHRVHVIRPMEQFSIGSWTVRGFDTPHDVENLGFLLQSGDGEKVGYLVDTPYCKYRFKALNFVLVECNYSLDILRANVENGVLEPEVARRVVRSHMSLEAVKGFLQANDLRAVEEIHLLHLSAGNSDAARFKREIAALTGKPVYVAEEMAASRVA